MTRQALGDAFSKVIGYRFLAADGGVFSFGAAPYMGTPRETRAPGSPWVAIGCTDDGYVAVDAVGSLAGFGSLEAVVEAAAPVVAASIVDIAVTPSGEGFVLLDAVGGVFCFGDSTFHGSIPGIDPPVAAAPAVSVGMTPTGRGYWILDQAGGVYCFGDARFSGSVPALRLAGDIAPAVDFAVSSSGDGYAVLLADGTIHAFGDAPPGSVDVRGEAAPVAFAAAGVDGYLAVDARGIVYPVGHCPMLGSAAGIVLSAPVVDAAVVEV